MYRRGIHLIALVLILQACYQDSVDMNTDFNPDPPTIGVETDIVSIVSDLQGSNLEGIHLSTASQEWNTDEYGVVVWGPQIFQLLRGGIRVSASMHYPMYVQPLLAAGAYQQHHIIAVPESDMKLEGRKDEEGSFEFGSNFNLKIPAGSVNDPHQIGDNTYFVNSKKLRGEELEIFQSTHPMYTVRDRSVSHIDARMMWLWSLRSANSAELTLNGEVEFTINHPELTQEIGFFQMNEEGIYEPVRTKIIDQQNTVLFLDRVAPIVIGREESTVLVSGKILDSEGLGAGNILAKLSDESSNLEFTFFTSASGNFQLYVPDHIYDLELPESCGQLSVGQFSASELSSEISLDATVSQPRIKSRVLDCDENPFEGYIMISNSGSPVVIPVQEGVVESRLPLCVGDVLNFEYISSKDQASVFSEQIQLASNVLERDLVACSSEPVTEAIITIGTQRVIFEDVEVTLQLDGGMYDVIAFALMGDSYDESHVYEYDGQSFPYWSSSSTFFYGSYAIMTISEEAQVDEFEVNGKRYLHFKLEDITFRDLNANFFPKGSVEYTVQLD